MSFDWKDFITFADQLSTDNRECRIRSCVSRAYFGAFCILRNIKGYKNYEGSDVHKIIIDTYRKSNIKNERRIGGLLDGLRWMRNEADYKEDIVHNQSKAKKAVMDAQNIIRRLSYP